MAATFTLEHPPGFSDMGLRVGQPLQLLITGAVSSKHYTRLIGYVDQEFMMLKVPQDQGRPVPFLEGQKLQIRVFSGVSLYQFESQVLALLHTPRNTMLMSPPLQLQETRMRAHARVKTQLPVHIRRAPAVASGSTGFHLEDLSGGGAAMSGPQALGKAGDTVHVAISFHLSSTGDDETVELTGRIQSLGTHPPQSGRKTSHLHGIQFDTTDPRILLLIYELQNNPKGAGSESGNP